MIVGLDAYMVTKIIIGVTIIGGIFLFWITKPYKDRDDNTDDE